MRSPDVGAWHHQFVRVFVEVAHQTEHCKQRWRGKPGERPARAEVHGNARRKREGPALSRDGGAECAVRSARLGYSEAHVVRRTAATPVRFCIRADCFSRTCGNQAAARTALPSGSSLSRFMFFQLHRTKRQVDSCPELSTEANGSTLRKAGPRIARAWRR